MHIKASPILRTCLHTFSLDIQIIDCLSPQNFTPYVFNPIPRYYILYSKKSVSVNKSEI